MTTWQQSTETRLGTLESDHRSLLQWFGGGAIALTIAIVTSYLLLSGQIAAQGDKVTTKLDAIVSQNAAVQTEIAVLKERVPPKP